MRQGESENRASTAVNSPCLSSEISQRIWDAKYRFRKGDEIRDGSLHETWQRVSRALAEAEPMARDAWAKRFYEALSGFRFLPGGRILAGAGTGRRVTLFNCFVMGTMEDSLDGIFDALKEGALTMQQGGGVGYDFSTLRPRGSRARSTGAIASGPVSFMEIWDRMCGTLLSTGARRGAMMATLRCDHPDIEEFIDAKRSGKQLANFNLSVQISDSFMDAVRKDAEWPLVFPADQLDRNGTTAEVEVQLNGPNWVHCRVLRRVGARQLWEKIIRSAYESAEPGVLFVDRINRLNNLWYCEHLSATNPCGEIPLPPTELATWAGST